MTRRGLRLLAALLLMAGGAARAWAEPMFLARQYSSCTTCHYSATGGGLLTPYGRSLSAQELSTWGAVPEAQAAHVREQEAFYGVLGDTGPVQVGLELRPSHLRFDVGGVTSTQDMLMTADVLVAWRAHGYTVYGGFGRQPLPEGTRWSSYEYWAGKQWDNGLGLRAGRFLPAYGINLADHTALTRLPLGLDVNDGVYAVELSRTTKSDLLQISAGPGRAEAVLNDDGTRAFTAAARYQHDLGSRQVVTASGLYRAGSQAASASGSGGLAYGIAPTRRLSIWTEADALFEGGTSGSTGWALLNETSLEAVRGLWLKISPQLRIPPGDASAGTERLGLEANWLPRTHWNLGASYYRDKSRLNDLVTHTLLAQIHLYL